MKRLDGRVPEKQAENAVLIEEPKEKGKGAGKGGKAKGKKGNADKSLLITVPVMTKEQAIDAKMRLLNTKLFGIFTIVTYELKSSRKVYMPFDVLRYSYELNLTARKKGNKKGGLFHRDAEVGVVFNVAEDHAFHYDLNEEIRMKTLDALEEGSEVIKGTVTDAEILERCKTYLTRKILGKAYKNARNIELEEKTRFYRPAYEIIVECRGREFVKYAYLDEYESTNEHISGLRPRLDMS